MKLIVAIWVALAAAVIAAEPTKARPDLNTPEAAKAAEAYQDATAKGEAQIMGSLQKLKGSIGALGVRIEKKLEPAQDAIVIRLPRIVEAEAKRAAATAKLTTEVVDAAAAAVDKIK